MQLPQEFVNNIQLSVEEKEQLILDLDTSPIISLRTNPKKAIEHAWVDKVEWAKNAYYLKERPSYVADPLFHAGTYYPQEASSMFIEQFMNAMDLEQKIVLDLCAAPGGKSTHLLSILPDSSLLVSNEVIKSRSWILKENIDKWGRINSVVTNNDPKDFSVFEGLFDIMVIDAPCSGEGMFRKDREARGEWSLNNVEICYNRQRRILADVWDALKEGGVIVYSTCTFNEKENQANIKWMCDNYDVEPFELDVDVPFGVHEREVCGVKCYNFYPGKVKGEGFFVTAFRKASGKSNYKIPKKVLKEKLVKPLLGEEFLTNPSQMLLSINNNIHAFPKAFVKELLWLRSSLFLLKAGTVIGEDLKRELKYSHELAFSTDLKLDLFEKLELSKEQAIEYLSKKDIAAEKMPKKWALTTFTGVPLGFVKNAGRRLNNYYPKEFRIRKLIS